MTYVNLRRYGINVQSRSDLKAVVEARLEDRLLANEFQPDPRTDFGPRADLISVLTSVCTGSSGSKEQRDEIQLTTGEVLYNSISTRDKNMLSSLGILSFVGEIIDLKDNCYLLKEARPYLQNLINELVSQGISENYTILYHALAASYGVGLMLDTDTVEQLSQHPPLIPPLLWRYISIPHEHAALVVKALLADPPVDYDNILLWTTETLPPQEDTYKQLFDSASRASQLPQAQAEEFLIDLGF